MTPTQHLIRDEILRRLAAGESLRAICRDDGFPNESTVREWARLEVEGFGAQYSRARARGYETLADELMEVSRSVRPAVVRKTVTKEAKDRQGNVVGEEVETTETETDAVDRARLHADTLKWTLAKMLPKVYGEKKAIEVSGPDGGPVQTNGRVTVGVDPVAASQAYQQLMDSK